MLFSFAELLKLELEKVVVPFPSGISLLAFAQIYVASGRQLLDPYS